MKTFKLADAQGEVYFRKIDVIPTGLKSVEPENDHFIVGHSETGHHHVLEREGTKMFEAKTAPEGMKILYALLDKPNQLRHLRPFDTHETIAFQPGAYEIRLGRQIDPYENLIKRIQD